MRKINGILCEQYYFNFIYNFLLYKINLLTN